MYSILIADDEKQERDGISRLLKRYRFDLKISLASNGEEALKEFEKEEYDILLTDIKMPFMDGIQLIKEIQKRGMSPICIIYSAYGEFEYAQNAISLGVLEYLLKPIRLDAFEELFHKVIDLCRARDEVEKEKAEMKHVVEEMATYKFNRNLLNYLESERYPEEVKQNDVQTMGDQEIKLSEEFVFEKNVCIPILISCYSNLFSIEWETYQSEIEKQLGGRLIIINKEDNQILVLHIRERGDYRISDMKKSCESLMEQSKRKYQTDVFIVVGTQMDSLKNLKKEYEEIKDQLDYQFFVSESMLIVHDQSYFNKKEKDMLSLYFERIYNCAKMPDYTGMKKEFKKVFLYIEKQMGFSSVYVKYTFTDAIKKISEYTKSDTDLLEYIKRIYEARSMEEVSTVVYESLDDMAENRKKEVKENRIIGMAKEMIYERYQESSLGVSSVAEELDISTAYLSSLFKIETGQNLVKFITRYRVEKSKELLKQSNMKVSDIALKVGYISVSYYISIFRNHEGCSPVQYRERTWSNEED